MFTVDQLNMAISGRTNPTLTKMLLAYPLVSISWMIVIEKGVIFGHSYTEYLNHNVNNLAHLLVTLGCPSVRAQILQCGYKECFATVVQFVTMYYCWVWYVESERRALQSERRALRSQREYLVDKRTHGRANTWTGRANTWTSEHLDERTPGRANTWTSEHLDELTLELALAVFPPP